MKTKRDRDSASSDSRMRALVESFPDVILVLNPAGVVVDYHAPRFATFFAPLPVRLKTNIRDIVPGSALQAVDCAFVEALQGGPVRTVEFEHDVQGVREVFEGRFTPMESPGVLAVFRTITASRGASLQLRETIQLQTSVLESAAHAIVVTDLDGSIEWVNPAFTALTQYTAEEAVGKNPRVLVKSGVHNQAFYKNLWDTILDGRVWRGEIVNRRKDGSLYHEDQMITPMRNERGEIRHFAAIKQDITAQKLAEKELRLSYSVLSKMDNVVYVVNAGGGVVYVSPSAERLLGYSPNDLLNDGWWNLTFIGPDQAISERLRAVAVVRGETKLRGESFERSVKAKDGSTRLMLFTESATSDNLLIRVGSDITAHRRVEDQFRQAQKMEAVGQLAGGVAHDFNNLLTIINGYSEILMNRLSSDDPARKSLSSIHEAGTRATSLTRQLLAFSRKQIIVPSVVDLNAVVKGMEKMLRRVIGEDIELKTTLDPSLGAVKADSGQLEQVLMNLVVNARDAMARGGKLTIETRNVELDESFSIPEYDVHPGPFSMLAITDDGCGMDDTVKSHIFEPFFTTKELGKGTGLGLPVVHGIIRQSGGHIRVHSELGAGTTFRIYLPHIDDSESSVLSETVTPAMHHGNETILLVEDEPGVRGLALHILESCGYRVLEADSGQDAMKVADAHQGPIHLVVTDVVMPNLGGRALAGYLARTRPDSRVLFVSGYTDDTMVRHGILNSTFAFLQKPFSAADLAQKVREVLDKPRTEDLR